jgi:hypothetical protein
MSNALMFNGEMYICVRDENELKIKSLEDNVYHTLRDICNNIYGFDWWIEADCFINPLTNGIRFRDRHDTFEYSNVLYDKEYLVRLIQWLNYISINDFNDVNNFDVLDENDEEMLYFHTNRHQFILLNDWWEQFNNLKCDLKEHYDKIINANDTQYVLK